MPSAFLDTNIPVYAAEESFPPTTKGATARDLLRESGLGLSVQVLNEFVASARHPDKLALDRATELSWLTQFMRLEVAVLNKETFLRALEIHGRYETSHWDSLILAAARQIGSPVVYSEDMNDGQDYGGVRVVNPFRSNP